MIDHETTGLVLDPYAEVQDKQGLFLEEGAKFKLMGGAQGGGKSRACRMEGFRSSETIERCKGLVLRRTRGEVVKNFVQPLLEETRIVQDDGSSQAYLAWIESKNVIRFPNGSTIDIGYCENDRHVERYRGLEYDWICIEELTQWKEDWWQKVMTSLRTTKPGVRPFFFGSTNPGGIGHGWVKRRWINRQFTKDENPADFGMVRATIYDNPALMAADPSYLPMLMSLPDKERRARLFGDWDAFEGQFFGEYREDLHVRESFYPTQGIVRRVIAIDYGYGAPACVLWGAIDTQGRVWVYRELYGPGMLYADMARKIAALTREDEIISGIVVDPAALNKKNEATGTSLADEFVKVANETEAWWLKNVQGANNNRAEGWLTVRKYLQERVDPNSGHPFALLQITRSCPNLIRTMPDQIHDKLNVEDLDTKGEDHPPDTLRYLLMEFGINITTIADLKPANDAANKGRALDGKSQKEREFQQRGITRSKGLLDKKF